ncbi:MAG: hypothetical protein U0I22_00560 [Treponema sp.]|nr:hypothetical protein [Treponema sp.]
MKRNTRFVLAMVCIGLFMMIMPSTLNAAGVLEEVISEPEQHIFFNSEEEFKQALRAYAPNYQYIWVYQQSATLYTDKDYSQKGNLFTWHIDNNLEYCILCSNYNPGYYGVRQFYNHQVEDVFSYMDEILWNLTMQSLMMFM